MSDNYTPDEYTAKQMYVLQRQSMHNHISPDYGAEFDAFISKIKADAWDEGYETGCSSPYGTATPSGKSYDPEPNPYRER